MSKISVKFALLLLIIIGVSSNICPLNAQLQQETAELSLRKAPYLIYNGTNSEYVLMWQLNDTQNSLLRWGVDTTYSLGSIESAEYGDDHQHKYTFTGLIPGNKYYYSVTIDSKEYKGDFIAAPSNDASSVKFIAYGDTRGGTDDVVPPVSHERVAAQILSLFEREPEYQGIITFVGDAVKRGGKEHYWDEQFFNTSSDFKNMQKLRASVGYQFAIGNHEDVDESNIFKKYYIYPYEKNYYWAFDYGPVRFFVLDQYDASYSAGSAQMIWLENELKTTDKKWKIIVLHKTGWSVGHHGSDEPTQQVIQPLCEKYGVKLLLGGHNHLYARAYEKGVYHITTGGGGASVVVEGDTTEEHLQKVVFKHHFCKIDINDDLLKCDVIDDEGNKIDEFSIQLGAYILVTSVNGSGRIIVDPDSASYHAGTEVHLTAVADSGWEFVNWLGDLDGTDSAAVVAITGNLDITANFKNISATPSLSYDGYHASTVQGVVNTKNEGYTGDGYANVDNETGTYVEWNYVNMADAGDYDCTIRYANGSDNNRPGTISVNGTVLDSFSGASTGSFSIWSSETTGIKLNAGNNVIRLTGTTSESLGNIDKIDLKLTSSFGSLDVRVADGNDDAEQHADNSVDTESSDLELTEDGNRGAQTVGIRFNNIDIPQGAQITAAYIQFTADEVSEGACSLIIKGEAADNAAAFAEETNNISNRSTTLASVNWSPQDWTVKQEAGDKQRTPELKTVIQEIINRSGWHSGGSLAILITGNGKRTAESYNGSADEAPKLHIEYTVATSISNNGSSNLPVDYTLFNYPNPFNPVTVIRYEISQSGFVSIKVFNTLGQKVATVVSGFKKAGNYNVKFNAANLPSGVYVYSIQINGYVGFNKMVLIR